MTKYLNLCNICEEVTNALAYLLAAYKIAKGKKGFMTFWPEDFAAKDAVGFTIAQPRLPETFQPIHEAAEKWMDWIKNMDWIKKHELD